MPFPDGMMAKLRPPSGRRWVPGAEPFAFCMSCNKDFPLGTTECPDCKVELSLVRKCPSCQHIQSFQHSDCRYCSAPFLTAAPLDIPSRDHAVQTGAREKTSSSITSALLVAAVVVILAGIYLLRPQQPTTKTRVSGESEVIRDTVLRQRASQDAPIVNDLHAAEKVTILGLSVDAQGGHWFRVAAGGVSGFVRVQEVTPPRGNDPEGTYEALRESLLVLSDPSALPDAKGAIQDYERKFSGSPHRDELEWLLAETTRRMAESSSGGTKLWAEAREEYRRIARGNGEFAAQARQALDRIPSRTGAPRSSPKSDEMRLTIEGGESRAAPAPRQGALAVRSLTVLTRTPLEVRLSEPAEIAPGATFHGEIDQDIRVNNQLAVPHGSVCRITVVGAQLSPSGTAVSATIRLRLDSLVIDGQPYRVSASAVRIEYRAAPSTSDTREEPEFQLPAGTLIAFRLETPLVIARP